MPSIDRQSIHLLAYRNSLERDQQNQVGSCENFASYRYLQFIDPMPDWASNRAIVRLKFISRLSMARKAKLESMVKDISTRAPQMPKKLCILLDGHETDPKSHGRQWRSMILDEMIQYTNMSVMLCP